MKRAILRYINRPPNRWEARLTLLAFVWMLLQLCSPGSIQMIPEVSLSTVLRSPLSGLIHIHVMSVLAPFFLVQFIGALLFTIFQSSSADVFSLLEAFVYQFANIFVALLWLLVFWSWLLKLIALCFRHSFRWQTRLPHWRSPRWWMVPVLALTLCGLWSTRLPLKVAFQFAKPTLNQVADAAIASPNGVLQLPPLKQAGPFAIIGAYRLDENLGWGSAEPSTDASDDISERSASIEIPGFWVHQGFMRDFSQPEGRHESQSFGLVSGSSGTDEVFYLGDGWYAFQNYLD